MKNLLLDTHTLIWALGRPDKLGDAAKRSLEDKTNGLYVSSVSAWEIANKHRIGKLPGVEHLLENFSTYLNRLGASELGLSMDHAILGGQLNWQHRDPFDRMLAAQAIIEDLVLVSRDPAFQELAELETLW